MITLQCLAVFAALSDSGQPVLLDFDADWCSHCRAMDPVVRRLIAEGYPVRKVNIDQERQLTRKYRVRGVPTFVLTVDGQEVDRVAGRTSYSQLAGMFRKVPPTNAKSVAGANQVVPAAHVQQTPTPTPGIDPRARAMQATVRLRIEDSTGTNFGTGTIVDTHGDDALVVTCGHIFRDSGGHGKIMVDLFAPGARGPVPGELIACNLEEDVALVAIRLGIKVVPVPVPPKTYQVRQGDRVFGIGCDHGRDPTLLETHVIKINKYVRPDNIAAAGEPAIGRSGGGLFSADGQLIGVCNMASPTDREGIYAALSLIHGNLDKSGLAVVYQRNSPQLAATPTEPPPPAPDRQPPHQPPAMPKMMPRSPLDDRGLEPVRPSAVATHEPRAMGAQGHMSADTEIICILRSKSNPQAQPKVIFFDRPPQDLLNRLAEQPLSDRTIRPLLVDAEPDSSVATRPPRRSFGEPRGGPVVRGQSGN